MATKRSQPWPEVDPKTPGPKRPVVVALCIHAAISPLVEALHPPGTQPNAMAKQLQKALLRAVQSMRHTLLQHGNHARTIIAKARKQGVEPSTVKYLGTNRDGTEI